MRKFLIVLAMIAITSFLFVGCLPGPTNQVPIITSTPVKTATVGVEYTYDVNATDPDNDVLTYSLDVKPIGMIIDSTNGLIKWTPIVTQVGDNSVVVKISDGSLSSIQSFIIAVSAVEPEPPVEETEVPVITSVPLADDGYINKTESITTVIGYSVDGSIVKLYFDGKLIGTTVASKAKSSYAIFEFKELDVDLGKDGEKTLYATAKEYGLAVSDPSELYTFILDTTAPKLETASIDDSVFEDGDFVLFLADDTVDKITVEVSEPVSLVIPDNASDDYKPVIKIGDRDWATFEISEDGLTLILSPADEGQVNFYTYLEGKREFSYEANLLKDVAGNGNATGSFTLTFVDMTPPEY